MGRQNMEVFIRCIPLFMCTLCIYMSDISLAMISQLFLELQKTLKPLGVTLPSELINSPYLHLQREEHQNRGKKSKAKRSDSTNW